ncbi:hypothetical protein BURPS1710b_A1309 [Burkholderia pseudomallei 1710b]|uniref:Uncharacterized protein n=1 Tax=Burkholderia pseudomallei (strain 1710b) TaxID=320372 RepID=Q3JIY8_BURP1|nr:hypothetical protein BURPS1710b_A1309 [Burkholderia pseudomallei 1710b]
MQRLRRDRGRIAAIAHGRRDEPQQIARIAREKRHPRGAVQVLQQVVERRRVRAQRERRAVRVVHVAVAPGGQRPDVQLRAEPPQERVVAELRGREVAREHRPHVERHLEAHAARERELVDVAIERQQPAVEQVARRDALAAEIVDDVDSRVRLHVRRGLVIARRIVAAQVELGERQLAARQHDRPAAQAPAAVAVRAVGGARRVDVHERIVNLDDFARCVDRVRNRHVAAQQRAEALGEIGLAAAGGAVDEQRPAGVQRGGGRVEHRRLHHDAVECRVRVGARDRHVAHRMRGDARDVRFVRDGRRAAVAVARFFLERERAAELRQAQCQVDVGQAAVRDFDQALACEERQHLVEHGRRQAVARDDLGEARAPVREHRFQQQRRDEGFVQAGFRERARRGRQARGLPRAVRAQRRRLRQMGDLRVVSRFGLIQVHGRSNRWVRAGMRASGRRREQHAERADRDRDAVRQHPDRVDLGGGARGRRDAQQRRAREQVAQVREQLAEAAAPGDDRERPCAADDECRERDVQRERRPDPRADREHELHVARGHAPHEVERQQQAGACGGAREPRGEPGVRAGQRALRDERAREAERDQSIGNAPARQIDAGRDDCEQRHAQRDRLRRQSGKHGRPRVEFSRSMNRFGDASRRAGLAHPGGLEITHPKRRC